MHILILKLRWNQVEILKKSLGSFFIIAAVLNISYVILAHSFSSLSAGLILIIVSIYTTVSEENRTIFLHRIRGPFGLLRSSFWSKGSVLPLKPVCSFKTRALCLVKLLKLRLPSSLCGRGGRELLQACCYGHAAAELFVWLGSCCISCCTVSPSLHFATWWVFLLEMFFFVPGRNRCPIKGALPQQPTRFHCITKLICLKWDI